MSLRTLCAASLSTSSLWISLSGAALAQSDSIDQATARVPAISIPSVPDGPKRAITTDDLVALRDVDSFSLSPDGKHFALLLRQADVAANDYRTGWFIGSTQQPGLIPAGDGGEVRLTVGITGRLGGDVAGSASRWSADGKWIAYTLKRNGEIQLWRSSVDGGTQQQLTHNAADVRDFVWSEDGKRLLFTVGSSRAALQARDTAERRNGFQLEEFQYFTEVIYQATPDRPAETRFTTWSIDLDTRAERIADAGEQQEFIQGKQRHWSWGRDRLENKKEQQYSGATAPPVLSESGAAAWLALVNAGDLGIIPKVRLTAALRPDSKPIACIAEECVGQMFSKLWWSADGKRVVFWRDDGINFSEQGFYAWSPATGRVTTLWRSAGDRFKECELVAQKLVCVRETRTRPAHVAAIDTSNGRIAVLADVNPEFTNLRMAASERIEWDTPPDTAQLGYPKRSFGYVFYPPDFDPKKKYPVIVAPYGAQGFARGDVGDEQPMLVYAAQGLVVVNSAFPFAVEALGSADPTVAARKAFSAELGFPHQTMIMESTFRALDTVEARGWVDSSRIGIGGLSQGSLTPAYMLQKYDRLTAVSMGPAWTQMEYYFVTRNGRAIAARNNAGHEWPESLDYWSKLDLADHIDEIEAPLLFQLADRESYLHMRLQRRLGDAQKPFDTYIFENEYHQKWQPAHRYAVYNRNLDWFRFWLQDAVDAAPEKAGQYARWKQLRELQCRNPRSLRNYCGLVNGAAAGEPRE